MTTPFIGEIRMFGGNFAPVGHLPCDGRLLSIAEYDTLYALIGTTYGGDGVQSFALPDLRGRAPVHMGRARSNTTYVQGQSAGTESVALLQTQMPQHSHPFTVNTAAASSPAPANNIPATPTVVKMYDVSVTPPIVPATPMAPGAISVSGGNLPHENMQPFVAVTFIIAVYGVFPSHN